MFVPPIETDRLQLVSLSPAFLAASQARDRTAAERELGLAVPDAWFTEQFVIDMRLQDVRANPSWQPWLLRAVVLRQGAAMAGHVGFHTPPGPAYLQQHAPGGIEIGYTIYAEYRRQGYAAEAVSGMIDYARGQGVQRFVLSIRPDNQPSLAIARRFGFAKVASVVDEIDGVEDVYVLG
ncbi:MAG: GNAT family N-acetyltransferase [Roseiflexaceae bacterium]|nr:GNAT family N-acetyltransferase [Roseiflexaceae bacterium]